VGAVFDIKQSADGYLWLTTSKGVLRFDGVRFQSVKEVTRGAVFDCGKAVNAIGTVLHQVICDQTYRQRNRLYSIRVFEYCQLYLCLSESEAAHPARSRESADA